MIVPQEWLSEGMISSCIHLDEKTEERLNSSDISEEEKKALLDEIKKEFDDINRAVAEGRCTNLLEEKDF